jgi:hypothetical protein
MDLTTITVAQFQAQFVRDFQYLPTYSSTATYNSGAYMQYTDGFFYECLSDGTINIAPPAPQSWKKVQLNANDYILNSDIQAAFTDAQSLMAQGLFSSTALITLGYLYLSAHFLAMNIRNSNMGLNSRPEFVASARTVGGISETYELPERFKDDPILQGYLKTGYGLKYLNMILPQLVGNVQSVEGTTRVV